MTSQLDTRIWKLIEIVVLANRDCEAVKYISTVISKSVGSIDGRSSHSHATGNLRELTVGSIRHMQLEPAKHIVMRIMIMGPNPVCV
jgi:hypothetical protein